MDLYFIHTIMYSVGTSILPSTFCIVVLAHADTTVLLLTVKGI